MAVPGFSVSDLIQAVGQIKTVFDAFFHQYANSAKQVRDLADHIQLFQTNLETHKGIIQKRGLEYSGYLSIKRTLAECEELLDKYRAVLDRKVSVEKLWRTGRFPYEQDTVARLQRQIDNHASHILHFNMNILLQDGLPREPFSILDIPAQALDIPSPSPNLLVARSPPLPPLFPESAHILESSQLSISPGGVSPQSPKWVPTSGFASRQDSIQGSPYSHPVAPEPIELDLQNQSSDIILQAPLDYCVAKVYIGETKKQTVTELRRKAKGRYIQKARELLIFDEKGRPRLRHQIKLRTKQCCYPYSWHNRWNRDLEITFKGIPADFHSVKFYEQAAGPDIPSYVFTKHEDYMEFQSEVRGQELIDYFNIDRLVTASAKKEATHQHLKVWKNNFTRDYSISFYASAAETPSDVEFPLSMFMPDLGVEDDDSVKLNFIIVGESRGRIFGRDSRTSIARSQSSSIASSVPSTFSHNPTPIRQATMTTIADSGASAVSTGSEYSSSQKEDGRNSLSPLEIKAKKMKYISIEFSDDKEADRFCKLYQKAKREEASMPQDSVWNWQCGDNSSQRALSVTSNMSLPGTPFNMSPVLRALPSPVLRPQR